MRGESMVTRAEPLPCSQTSIKNYSLTFALFELLTIFLNSSSLNHLLSIKTSPKSDILDKSYQGNKIQWLTFVT